MITCHREKHYSWELIMRAFSWNLKEAVDNDLICPLLIQSRYTLTLIIIDCSLFHLSFRHTWNSSFTNCLGCNPRFFNVVTLLPVCITMDNPYFLFLQKYTHIHERGKEKVKNEKGIKGCLMYLHHENERIAFKPMLVHAQ